MSHDTRNDQATPSPHAGQLLQMRHDALGLEPLSATQRMDNLISRPDAREAVRDLEPLELYHLIRSIGRADATELATLASPEQIQAFIDLDCWQRDRFDPGRMARWFETLIDLEDEDLQRTMRDLDPEIPALFFKGHLQVFLLDEEKQAPPELSALGLPWSLSPDNVYAIVYPEDETASRLMRKLLDRLYEVDISLARILLEAARWELISPMEEAAYQVRRARLEEFGFVDPYEALALFSWRDPDKARVQLRDAILSEARDDDAKDARVTAPAPAGWALPAVFKQTDSDTSFFVQALATFADIHATGDTQNDVRDIMYSVVLLTNKAMSALQVEPGDRDATRRTFGRVRGTLGLALEYLADRNLALAARILDHTHLQNLFQIGYSLTLKLSRQAEQLLQNPWLDPTLSIVDDAPYSLLADDDRLVLTSLLKRRPEFGDPNLGYSTPFTSLHQVEVTAARMSLLAFKVMAVYGLLGVTRDRIAEVAYSDDTLPAVESINLNTLLATAIARAALGHPGDINPLTTTELAHFIDTHLRPAAARLDPLTTEAPRTISELAALDDTPLMLAALSALAKGGALGRDALPIARATLRRQIENLVEDFAGLDPNDLRAGDLEPHLLGSGLLLGIGD